MKSLRNVVAVATALFALAYSGNAFAADPAPGAACSVANAVVRSGGPENAGVIHEMVCQGSVWVVRLTYAASNSVGIGTTNPGGILDVQTAGSAGSATTVLNLQSAGEPRIIFSGFDNANNDYNPELFFQRARGTMASPSRVQDTDELGCLRFRGYDSGGFYKWVSGICAVVDGATGSNDIPSRLTFTTSADGAATESERMRITSAGNIGIGTTAPSVGLEVDNPNAGVANDDKRTALVSRGTTDWLAMRAGDATPWLGFKGTRMSIVSETAKTNSWASGTELVSILSGGNVGIGSTNPGSKLEVNGRVAGAASTDADALSAITLDFSATNMIQATASSAACGTLNFTNVVAGGNYTVTIPNATATCTTIQLNGATTNRKLPSGYTGGVAAAGLVYTAIYDGTTLWVSYVPFQ